MAEVEVADGISFPDTNDGNRWVVGGVITDGTGRAFAQRRSPNRALFPHCWDIVGGHVEPGESMLDALGREITEETGWRLTAVLADLYRLVWTPGDGVDRYEIDYLVRVDGDLSAPELEREKHTEFMWVDENETHLLRDHRDPGDYFVADIVALGLGRAKELGC
ncbi:ADP-ribose pyrophosphatase YjhB (NUDIX family) [Haloactinospora alba]|uniref:ADP-ribose pyrophosphatase YjhB (NUDIX family) n=1 Tax=Haloactinospora alba TaxID=405555 RepID=A0A543NMH2_9ACTN|nr:NUDIX domain-containing protein [Haloactinospora alba]TQN33004.1 ADP-ribose pyrophosphatase YjhB (NUDIX family) [Haloactinospora alba]